MRIGVDDAGNPPSLIEELKPVDDRVVAGLPAGGPGRRPVEDRVERMDLDDVHLPVHAREAGVGTAVAVAVAEHPADVGMIDLDELLAGAVPEGQPFDLDLGIIVGGGRAVILGVGPHDQREGILVIERQRTPRQLDPDARGHPALRPQALQVRVVAREAVVFGAGGEFDLLAQQVQHPAELAGRVVARGARMAVEVGADPALGLHRADQSCLEEHLLAPTASTRVKTASYSGPWLTITSYEPGSSSRRKRPSWL